MGRSIVYTLKSPRRSLRSYSKSSEARIVRSTRMFCAFGLWMAVSVTTGYHPRKGSGFIQHRPSEGKLQTLWPPFGIPNPHHLRSWTRTTSPFASAESCDSWLSDLYRDLISIASPTGCLRALHVMVFQVCPDRIRLVLYRIAPYRNIFVSISTVSCCFRHVSICTFFLNSKQSAFRSRSNRRS